MSRNYKDYQFPADLYYYITNCICVANGLPDDPLYVWAKDSYYKLSHVNIFEWPVDLDYKMDQFSVKGSFADFETNTIKILELENMLIMFDYLINKRIISSTIHGEKLMKERELIIKEINDLRNNSVLVTEEYDIDLYPKKTYINNGYSRAKRRYRDAIRRKR